VSTIVLYDGNCGFCKWTLNVILRWDRARRLAPVAIQSDEGCRHLGGLGPEERLDSWHLVTEDGQLYSAGAAAAPLARLLPGGRPLAVLFAAFPGATEAAYRVVANHRSELARLVRVDSSCDVRR